MKSERVPTWIWTVVAAFLGACGGQTNESTPSVAPAAAADFPKALAHAICANVGGCCAQHKFAFGEAKCESTLSNAYERHGELFSADYDRTRAQQCLVGIVATVKNCDFTSKASSPDACEQVMGTAKVRRQNGGSCNATCTETGGSESCFSESFAGADGGAPQGSGACYTNDGLYCDFSHGACAPQHEQGEACSAEEECKGGVCGELGVCVPRSKMGEDCSYDYLSCADGLYCDGATCLGEKGLGAACNGSDECASHSCSAGVCGDQSEEFLKVACMP